MRSTAPVFFDRSQAQVEGMMEQGAAFARVEEAIETAPIPSDHKAALWLFAWSLRDHALQRRDARRMLAAVGAAD
jgi:hypothetical protein